MSARLIRLKDTVRPRSLVILAAVANEAAAWNRSDVYITSGNDGIHMEGSQHGNDNALDVRSKDLPNRERKIDFLKGVLARLGPAYQGILEHEGKPNEHFHFEYDPSEH